MARTKRRPTPKSARFEIAITEEEILAQLEPLWFGPGAEPGAGRTR
jgi:hypothetical protein